MNRANSTRTVALSGLILIVLTVGLFFLLTDSGRRTAVDWWGFGIMLFAELAATLGIIGLHNAQPAVRPILMTGGLAALTIYAVASVVSSAVFMMFFREAYKRLIAVEIALIAVALIFILVLYSNAMRLAASNSAVMYSVTAMGGLVSRAEALSKNHSGAPFGKSLAELYEGLRYCDNTVMTPADQQIHQQLYDLETLLAGTPEPEAVERQIGVLRATLRQRGVESSQTKRGTI